jgi:hypothetical protein
MFNRAAPPVWQTTTVARFVRKFHHVGILSAGEAVRAVLLRLAVTVRKAPDPRGRSEGGQTAMIAHKSFTAAEKREATERVLNSETFARSEQLRRFLQYVCEMEIDGRGCELNEYMIGVDVLHRPKGYSPGNDSSVRSRAYELRQRLERYYEKESAGSPIRIELPKGSYVPLFIDASAPRHLGDREAVAEVHVDRPHPVARWPLVASFLGGALLVAALGSVWIRTRTAAPAVDAVVREAWGPLLQPGANVLVCIGSTLHMVVRPNWQENPNSPPRFKAFPELYPIFKKERPLRDDVELFMHPTDNSLDFGELKAAVAATGTLRSLGVGYQLLPERATSIAALRGRNAILLGNSQISNVANEELLRGVWTIDFEPRLGRVAIVNQKLKDRPTPFLGEFGRPGEPTWCCGLVTVLPSEGSGNSARTVVISGITATGTDAAMEYFSSPAALRDLRQRFLREGLSGFPTAYQVVVKCKSKDTFLLASEYAAHHVLAR